MKSISLDITKAAQFLSEGAVKAYEPQVVAAQEALENGTCPGNDFLGWLHLPSSITPEFIAELQSVANTLREKCEVVVVAGIGGSYLGARAVIEALGNSFAWLVGDKKNPTVVFAGNNIAWNTVAAVCCGICLSFTYSVIWGILPDTANYGEWKTGIRATGFIYAIGVFALKLGSAIANMGAGTYLQILGYDPALGMEQTAGCAHGIYLANGWTSIVLGLIGSIVFLLFFKLDKATMDKVEHELAERRAKKVGTAE